MDMDEFDDGLKPERMEVLMNKGEVVHSRLFSVSGDPLLVLDQEKLLAHIQKTLAEEHGLALNHSEIETMIAAYDDFIENNR